MVDDNGESIKIQKVPSGLSQSMLLFWGVDPSITAEVKSNNFKLEGVAGFDVGGLTLPLTLFSHKSIN